jgi:ABC-2 type transport system ATP-binding protein
MQPAMSAQATIASNRQRIATAMIARARGAVQLRRAAEILTKRRIAFISCDLMVEVRGLTKFYGDFRAIHDVSFTAERGEILGLLGPNGAGKTTTMRIVTGYMPASEGSVSVEGFDVAAQAQEARRRIGYLPENPPLYHDMTVSSYLKFVGRIKGVARGELSAAVERVIERCFLTEVTSRILSRLSKGYRQRVGLAQALIHNPPVIVLDEPTIGLDPRQIIEIRGLIKELAADRTVILSTHILPEVSQICQKVVIINEGTVVVEKSLKELAQGASLEEVFLRYISKEPEAAAL